MNNPTPTPEKKPRSYTFTHSMREDLYIKLNEFVKKDGGYKNVQELLNRLAADFINK